VTSLERTDVPVSDKRSQSMKMMKSLIFGVAMLAAVPSVADEMRRETVRFAPGSSSSTIKASLKGYQTVRYSLSVTAGQKMSVQLDSRNTSLYFNVTAPGADAAMHNSSINGNGTSITIPSSGKYVIEVYLMRNAARRNESGSYDLTLYVE
jgi:hypothetical protein